MFRGGQMRPKLTWKQQYNLLNNSQMYLPEIGEETLEELELKQILVTMTMKQHLIVCCEKGSNGQAY